MKAVDLFCGAGGFSLGAHLAGIQVVSSYDFDPILTSSYSYNFPATTLNIVDVRQLSGAEVLNDAGGTIDCVFGGPPCQGFSSIGKRDTEDPRRELLSDFFRLVSEIRPTFFVMENVLGLGEGVSRKALDAALELVIKDYNILGPLVLDAADFGAATSRKRLFVIGGHKLQCDLPSAAALKTTPPATVADAITDLSGAAFTCMSDDGFDTWKLRSRSRISEYAKKLRSDDRLFTGNQRTKHTGAVQKRFAALREGEIDRVGRHPRLAWNGHCPTLRAGTGSDKGSYQSVRPVHPTEPRVITVREAARLQGFPDRHRFHPTIWHSFRMIGNSVSPFVAKAVFYALRTVAAADSNVFDQFSNAAE